MDMNTSSKAIPYGRHAHMLTLVGSGYIKAIAVRTGEQPSAVARSLKYTVLCPAPIFLYNTDKHPLPRTSGHPRGGHVRRPEVDVSDSDLDYYIRCPIHGAYMLCVDGGFFPQLPGMDVRKDTADWHTLISGYVVNVCQNGDRLKLSRGKSVTCVSVRDGLKDSDAVTLTHHHDGCVSTVTKRMVVREYDDDADDQDATVDDGKATVGGARVHTHTNNKNNNKNKNDGISASKSAKSARAPDWVDVTSADVLKGDAKRSLVIMIINQRGELLVTQSRQKSFSGASVAGRVLELDAFLWAEARAGESPAALAARMVRDHLGTETVYTHANVSYLTCINMPYARGSSVNHHSREMSRDDDVRGDGRATAAESSFVDVYKCTFRLSALRMAQVLQDAGFLNAQFISPRDLLPLARGTLDSCEWRNFAALLLCDEDAVARACGAVSTHHQDVHRGGKMYEQGD
jgi:hypothetical protein